MSKTHQYHEIVAGDKFNHLTLLESPRRTQRGYRVKAQCRCKTIKEFWAKHIISGRVKSCGCLRSQTTAKKNLIHCQSHTRLYKIWTGMKKRCSNPNDSRYYCYGGKGIKVCKSWLSFEKFRKWAESNGYQDDLTIDRIKDDRDYKPSNCRWTPLSEQSHSKHKPIRRSDGVEYGSLKEAAADIGLKSSASLTDVLKGRHKTAGGFGWEYI